MSTQVSVYEAKSTLSALLHRVEAGDEIVIARHGRPVARLLSVTTPPAERVPGAWRDQVWIAEDFDDLADASLREWYEGPVEPR